MVVLESSIFGQFFNILNCYVEDNVLWVRMNNYPEETLAHGYVIRSWEGQARGYSGIIPGGHKTTDDKLQ